MKKLQITMIHDLVCSWCPIGYNNIKAAISNLNIDVDFSFLPFELNPEMASKGELIASYFSRQFGWDDDKLINYQATLIKTAAHAGINIDFSKRQYYYNTHKGHLLMHWAERFNKQSELNGNLIKAYFEYGQDISNIDVLLDIAAQTGLNKQEAKIALDSTQLELEIGNKFSRMKALNLKSIPAFMVNNNTLVSGSRSVEYFEKMLTTFSKATITT